MDSLIPEVQGLVKKIAKNHDIKNFTLDITNSAAKDGDGYIGVIEAACLKDKDSDKKINFVIKKTPTSIELRKQFPIGPAFAREIYLYEKILPEYVSFQTQRNVAKPFKNFPKLYGCVTEQFKETLVFENLKECGFQMTDRQKPFDSNHLNLVLKTYAKFHAVSHAMKKLEPEKFKTLTESIRTNVMMERNKGDEKTPQEDLKHNQENAEMAQGSKEMFKTCFMAVEDRPDLIAELQKSVHIIKFSLHASLEMYKDPYAVVTHSDCWSANMLFKYGDDTNSSLPTDVSIIDWQMSQLGHPIHDLSYFFLINAGKEDLYKWKSYLKSYHQALCENLDEFGIDSKTFYPFELLEEQWQKYSKLGFFMCLIMLPQTLSDTKTHDFSKMADNGENIFDLTKRRINISNLLKKRMTDLVEFMVANRLLQE